MLVFWWSSQEATLCSQLWDHGLDQGLFLGVGVILHPGTFCHV